MSYIGEAVTSGEKNELHRGRSYIRGELLVTSWEQATSREEVTLGRRMSYIGEKVTSGEKNELHPGKKLHLGKKSHPGK